MWFGQMFAVLEIGDFEVIVTVELSWKEVPGVMELLVGMELLLGMRSFVVRKRV